MIHIPEAMDCVCLSTRALIGRHAEQYARRHMDHQVKSSRTIHHHIWYKRPDNSLISVEVPTKRRASSTKSLRSSRDIILVLDRDTLSLRRGN